MYDVNDIKTLFSNIYVQLCNINFSETMNNVRDDTSLIQD